MRMKHIIVIFVLAIVGVITYEGSCVNLPANYKYVVWNTNTGMWIGQPIINKKQTYLGYFNSEEEAAICVANKLSVNVDNIMRSK